MSWAGEVDHVKLFLFYHTVQVGIDEVLAGAGSPVSHDFFLYMFRLQRALQKRIVQ